VTPRAGPFKLVAASPGVRLAAALVDYLILSGAELVLWAIAAYFNGWLPAGVPVPGWAGSFSLVGDFTVAVAILGAVAEWFAYFVAGEQLSNGQTIGKRLFRLRVVSGLGQPVGLRSSLIRNVLRVLDVYLVVGIIGLMIDRRGRRFGDVVANTYVVFDPAVLAVPVESASSPPVDVAPALPVGKSRAARPPKRHGSRAKGRAATSRS
jgi:uncharacterized RDD family membrane protein YckC